MNRQEYIAKAANWARIHGFSDIKANTEGYTKPNGYDRQRDGQSFVPDVTGKQYEQKSYFEIVLKTDELNALVSKLKLLHQLAAISGGRLYLMVPKGHLPFAKSILLNHHITAEMVNLS